MRPLLLSHLGWFRRPLRAIPVFDGKSHARRARRSRVNKKRMRMRGRDGVPGGEEKRRGEKRRGRGENVENLDRNVGEHPAMNVEQRPARNEGEHPARKSLSHHSAAQARNLRLRSCCKRRVVSRPRETRTNRRRRFRKRPSQRRRFRERRVPPRRSLNDVGDSTTPAAPDDFLQRRKEL